MGIYVLDLHDIDQTQVATAGGKGANLGELTRVDGISVPAGFVVTTEAFSHVVRDAVDERLEPAELRKIIEAIAIPDEVAAEITSALGEGLYAVRSSATAEDLPGASFAGQQDSYLNVKAADVLRHVSLCWASLFTDRAVAYRQRNGFDQHVTMAVVVQEMVAAQAAGVLFTADPVTSNRKITRVEAVPGLGEAFVSGLVNADSYQVRDGEIIDRAVATDVLTDAQVVELVRLGREIEAHFGRPQDIEWCLADGGFQIVQSRPITTLFPVPEVADQDNHVYVSVGHQQMMTDAMTPLGLSVWQLTTPRPMAEAGGRLFVDITPVLSVTTSRNAFLDVAGKSDPLIRDALETVLGREGFVPLSDDDGPGLSIPGSAKATIETDPDVVTELIKQNEDSVAALKLAIREKSGSELLDFILADFQELRRLLFDPRSSEVIMAGMQTTWWLNDHLQEWLGEKNAADVLTQSVPHNVTSEMGLALLDVADAIRPRPELVSLLQNAHDESFVDELPALQAYLDRYGMRCVGEIDITRPRWSEQPSTLLPVLLTNIRNFEQGAGKQRFEEGLRQAAAKEREVLERLRVLPDGEQKADETRRMIERVRAFTGYREYPKYGMVSRYFVYKQALLEEADRLVRAGVLDEREDIYFLRFQELQEVVRTQESDAGLIRQRRDAFRSYQTLTPPRVLTSDGEAISGSYRRDDLPAGAIVGLPVSAGMIEGRARVVLDVADADLEPGDILVTAYTDPSWSPLFVAIAGLVTEVGGVMTHGAVIAREYGLPAVVGVEGATRLIQDGQRIRVHGTDGYIEIVSD